MQMFKEYNEYNENTMNTKNTMFKELLIYLS